MTEQKYVCVERCLTVNCVILHYGGIMGLPNNGKADDLRLHDFQLISEDLRTLLQCVEPGKRFHCCPERHMFESCPTRYFHAHSSLCTFNNLLSYFVD